MINRKLGRILYIILLFTGCTYEDFNPNGWAIEPTLDLSENILIFNARNNQTTINVTTNYETYNITCEDSWCKISTNIYNSSSFTIKVDPNISPEQRSAIVNVTVEKNNKSLTKTLIVVQLGGSWDVVGQFSIHWSSNITDSQKETISEILSNMVYIEGGTFLMGNDDYTSCSPAHNVVLSDYYINKTEVTQKQWNAIMGNNNSYFKGENLPIENIKWEDGLNFVNRLSELTNLNFALPTEAQWEYAARGGKYSIGYHYPGSDYRDDVMIYYGGENFSDPNFTTYEVGQLIPNELGLYDMAGNVSEMCFDWYGDYSNIEQKDPVGPAFGEYHVERGGCITSLRFTDSRRELITNTYVGIRLCIRP